MNQSAKNDVGQKQNAEQLLLWVRQTFGKQYSVSDVKSLGGHSGVTIGFDVVCAGRVEERLVLKTPPPGVARKNNFDVLRQVPLLKALEDNRIKAPHIKWWSDDEAIFGAPYLIMSRLAGQSPPDLFKIDAAEGLIDAPMLFAKAVKELVKIHAIDVQNALADWRVERTADAEIAHWERILHKTNNSSWLDDGLRLSERLQATIPSQTHRGLVHGDYYSNNWIFEKDELTGVVDWEGASIGPCLLDLGWLYMMYDPESWGPSRRETMHWQPASELLVETYSAVSDWPQHEILNDLPWYRALASFRIAAITAYYLEEHRSGRRPNDTWEMFGEAFPYLISQASRLVSS